MKTVFAQDFLLPLLLLAGINPLLSTALAAGGAAAIVPVLQTTFTNPTPAGSSDTFGAALAVMQNDRVVIGAPYAGYAGVGKAYLFNLNGVLLYQFHSSGSQQFGWSIATMPDNGDHVYIGDLHEYLYWCTTNSPSWGYDWRFSTPTPYAVGDQFGRSLAALGNDRLIVGAPNSTLGASVSGGVGAVFLYSSLDANPTPLTTITNPSPFPNGRFGASVAGVGDDRILIGAPGNSGRGKAYLFNTNGLLLTSFTNPTTYPSFASDFGKSVAALGSDRVIIGSRAQAFLFGVNGTLLTTFTNPLPNYSGATLFGVSVAAVGSDRVLIGSPRSLTNGAAFLFSTNGTLLAALTNPTGATNDSFGITVAVVGTDRVLIGDTRTLGGGAVYLFSLVPTLDIQPTPTNTLAVSWPLFAPDFLLQQNTNGLATGSWSNVTDTVQDDGTNKYIIIDPAVGNRFYRLSKQGQ